MRHRHIETFVSSMYYDRFAISSGLGFLFGAIENTHFAVWIEESVGNASSAALLLSGAYLEAHHFLKAPCTGPERTANRKSQKETGIRGSISLGSVFLCKTFPVDADAGLVRRSACGAGATESTVGGGLKKPPHVDECRALSYCRVPIFFDCIHF